MTLLWRSPLSRVWLLLLTATGLTTWLTETEHGVHWATLAILTIASAKIGLIMAQFMELKTAPAAWRWVFTLWLGVVTAIVLSGFVPR